MKKCIIGSIAIFLLASCASQNIDQIKVAEVETVEKQSKEKKSDRDCRRRSTGSRVKRC